MVIITHKKQNTEQRNKATPSWYEKKEIDALYKKAHRLTVETGIPHQVDHIVPLQHDKICGLHCFSNLQILTETNNKRKSNTFLIE